MREVVQPFTVAIPQAQLDDLNRRLDATRWPDPELVSDWSQGVPLTQMQDLVAYWRTEYDWRRCETLLNSLPQYTTEIDDVEIYFLHIRSPNPDALPMIISHGWPGSVLEFAKVIGPLHDPAAYGGDVRDAFHLVIPALPGFSFSGKPRKTGWSVGRIASAWHKLMVRLGYERYVAQGGDWGAAITTSLGAHQPTGLAAIHVNLPMVLPKGPFDELNHGEAEMLRAMEYYQRWEAGYSILQASRPQTLGYGLSDSPVGQAAWIFEKFQAWSDCSGNLFNILTRDEILDGIMLYWLTDSAVSSARLYWESYVGGFGATTLDIPTGCSIFPKEIYRAPRSWADRCIHNIIHWNELDKGGHFAALEQPDLFVDEVRTCFRTVR
ncbi:MAG: epoxide hydrolase [Sphingobium sp.]|nr:MAG: epoxide hydrolase [Sphingobium sp.]